MQIQTTDDGSPTLYREDIDEHYHSTKGALTESLHVYIELGLKHRAAQASKEELRVFEVGLGTGLNAVLSAMTGIAVHYIAIEKYPVDSNTVQMLDFGPDIDSDLLAAIHNAPWNTTTRISPTFRITKINADMASASLPGNIDVIYMDAFAPEKQPEMWTDTILQRLASMLAPGGVLTTYCAKGRIRRALQSFGLTPERLPGPPSGKREVLRASSAGV